MDHPSCAVQVALLPWKTVVGHLTLNQNVHPWVPTKLRLKFEHRALHAIEKIRCRTIPGFRYERSVTLSDASKFAKTLEGPSH